MLTKLAVLVLMALIVGSAAAQPKMGLGADGTGQVLHYPYYTVLGRFDTYVSVVNSTPFTKAVRVRHRDSKNGQIALELNLFLSPFDVWAGALTFDTQTGGARLLSRDSSCTVPSIPSRGLLLQTTKFTERDIDGQIINDTYARAAQGYIEMIEMGVSTNASVIEGTTHINGVPKNCGLMRSTLYTDDLTGTTSIAASAFGPPTGGLSGTGTLINVLQGVDFSYDAVALENVFTSAQHDVPGQTKPSIADAQRDAIFIEKVRVFTASFASGGDAVSALYQRSSASNEWITDQTIGAQTDLVFAFPTKWIYTGSCGVVSNEPFSNNGFCENGAPEVIAISAYDREERTNFATIDFCTSPPSASLTLDCTVGVYSVDRSNIFSLPNPKRYVPAAGTSGWIKFEFNVSPNRRIISLPGAKRDGEPCGTLQLRGLPVIGFGVQKYVNGDVGGLLSNYGGSFVHKYERSVSCQ
jgi:hypothetical protein